MNRMPELRCRFYVAGISDGIVFLVDDYDETNPTMTVTNDAEAVARWAALILPGHRIVYRDTEGQWDEIVPVGGGLIVKFMPYYGWHPDKEGSR